MYGKSFVIISSTLGQHQLYIEVAVGLFHSLFLLPYYIIIYEKTCPIEGLKVLKQALAIP